MQNSTFSKFHYLLALLVCCFSGNTLAYADNPYRGVIENSYSSTFFMSDQDGDGTDDTTDNCPTVHNPDQADLDNDGMGDLCDDDIDGDWVSNENDCDAYDNQITGEVWYADLDGDGWSDSYNALVACTQPEGYVASADGDCNDNDPTINPGATDYPYDWIDSDCDGIEPMGDDQDGDGIDDMYDNCLETYNHYQEDYDSDGEGDACDDDIDGDGFSNEQDCEPMNNAIHPDAPEVAGDGIDNNCNGQVDEVADNKAPVITEHHPIGPDEYYYTGQEYEFTIEVTDPEGDALTVAFEEGWGTTANFVTFEPSFPVSGTGTVNITGKIYLESGSGLFEYQLHAVDEHGNSTSFLADIRIADKSRFMFPADTIRVGTNQPFLLTVPLTSAAGVQGVYANDRQVMPFLAYDYGPHYYLWEDEGISSDKVGTYVLEFGVLYDNGVRGTDTLVVIVEEGCTNQAYYLDRDNDGYGKDVTDMYQGVKQMFCTSPEGYVTDNTDCNDHKVSTNPGAPEVAGDGIDNNCNGQVDEVVENQAPVITLSGDVSVPFEPGGEYWITVEATDPNPGDQLTLSLEDAGLHPDDYTISPNLPLTGTDTLRATIHFTPTRVYNYSEYNPMYFVARDAAGATDGAEWTPYVVPMPVFHKPSEPIVIGVNQPFYFHLKISSYADYVGLEWDAEAMGFGVIYQDDVALYSEGMQFAPTEEHIGTYKIPMYSKDVNNGVEVTDTVTLIVTADCTNSKWGTDKDKDGYGASYKHQLTCSSWEEMGYVQNIGDCNDNSAAIHPDTAEIPGDNIDNNCDGRVDEASQNKAPVITRSGDYGVHENYEVGKEYTFVFEVSDPDGDTIAISANDVSIYAQSLLETATFSPALPATGVGTVTVTMHWTPTEEQLRDQYWELVATDSEGNTTTEQFDWHAYQMPVFAIPSEPVRIGINQDFAIQINYEKGGYILSEGIDAPSFGYTDPDQMELIGNDPSTWATQADVGTHQIRVWALEGMTGTVVSDTITVIVEENCTNVAWYTDQDGDGYGTGNPQQLTCSPWPGLADKPGDCNDQNAAIHPGAPETAFDTIDSNCNGTLDDSEIIPTLVIQDPTGGEALVGEEIAITLDFQDPNPNDRVTLLFDSVFGENLQAVPNSEGISFSPALPYTTSGSGTVVMNWVPEEEHQGFLWFSFTVIDEHGNRSTEILPYLVLPSADQPFALQEVADVVVGTSQPLELLIPLTHPEAHQLDAVSFTADKPTWLQAEVVSVDGGTNNAVKVWGTPPANGWGIYTPTIQVRSLLARTDTQELYIRVGNCQNQLWYSDADGDGFGAATGGVTATACWQPEGYVSTNSDCDDADASIYPGATELQDSIDNNCDGTVDEDGSCYASQVVSFRQGYRPDGGIIGANRSNPQHALGAPQENNDYNFVSLGFGGELVLELGDLLYDDGTTAPDLMVVETTWGWAWRPCYDAELAGNPETMVMEVSANGTDWVQVPGTFCRNVKVDLSPVVGEGKLPYVRYIRITDTSNPADFHPSSNGYDVDGIITCRELFEDQQTNSRTSSAVAGGFNPNAFNTVPEEEATLDQLTAYPNPVRDELTIETGQYGTAEFQLQIYNLQGGLVYKGTHQPNTQGELKVKTSELKSGIYLLRIESQGLQHYMKIVKE